MGSKYAPRYLFSVQRPDKIRRMPCLKSRLDRGRDQLGVSRFIPYCLTRCWCYSPASNHMKGNVGEKTSRDFEEGGVKSIRTKTSGRDK